jgi:tetratricopeptide (TPR) repeat protein
LFEISCKNTKKTMQTTRLDNLLKLLEQQPDDPFLLYAAAFEYESSGDESRARAGYEGLLERHEDYLPIYYQLGNLLFRNREYSRAKAILEKGVKLAQLQKNSRTLRELNEALNLLEEEME